MRIFIGFFIGLVIAAGIALAAVKVAWGDIANMEDRDRSSDISRTVAAGDFDRLNIAGVFELKTTVGEDYSVRLSGREEDLDRTIAEVTNGVLVLDTGHKNKDGKRRIIKHSISAMITMPALNGVDIAGVVDGDISGVGAEDFAIDVSGVAEVDFSGACGTLTAHISGVGELDAEELQCRKVKVDVSGIGEARVYASESVDAELNGIGRIHVYGSPAEISKSQSSPIGRITVH